MTPRRRLRRHPAALEITAFLNLIVVLVPFLLSTAVFSRLAVLEMTLPAPAEDVEEQRRPFAQLASCLAGLKRDLPQLDTLSIGMSDDMEAAIAEGATMLRIGTALFGPRGG